MVDKLKPALRLGIWEKPIKEWNRNNELIKTNFLIIEIIRKPDDVLNVVFF